MRKALFAEQYLQNIQRKDLSAIEEAQSYKKILDMGYLTQEELAKTIGVPYEIVNRRENNSSVPEDKNINQLYSFAYGKKVYSNVIHEQMIKGFNCVFLLLQDYLKLS